VLSGCSVGGTSTTAAENDRLRREAIELNRQLELRSGEIAELRAKLAESERGRIAAMDPAVLDAIPRVTKVEFGMLAGLATPRGATEPMIVFDFATLDGRGRFTQAVGSVTVDATFIHASDPSAARGSGASEAAISPAVVASRTFTPAQLRGAYRAGLGSAAYVFEVAPSSPIPGAGNLVLRVSFSDAITGETHTATKVTLLRGGR
jgi:hypothetical protein